jgi:peptidoglycan/LPS O-acetylase OafA/YrhL
MLPLDSLTALRFFAALYVLIFHRRVKGGGEVDVLHRIIAHGYVAVPLFFVLSGFVLAYKYVATDGRVRTSAPAFYAARFARIYPVYLLAFVLFTPTAFRTRAIPAEQWMTTIASTLTLTQSWTERISWNKPGWTVSTEAFFYLAFPFLVPAVRRLRGSRLLWAVVILWLAGMAPVVAYHIVLPADALWLRIVKHNPVMRLPEFLIGVATGKLFLDRQGASRSPRWIACLVVALAALAAAVAIETPGAWYVLWHNGFLAPLFAFLIYALARGDEIITRIPGWAVLTRLGEASYGMYIMQTPVHSLCMGVMSLIAVGNPEARHAASKSGPFVAAYILVLIGLSLLSLRWYEGPARAAIRRLTMRGRTRHRSTAALSGAPPS